METKQKFGYLDTLKESLGYENLVTVEPIGLSGGLAVMWKEIYKVEVLSKNTRVIDLRVKLGSISFFLSCVYGDPVREKRQAVWDQLINIGLNRDEAWVMIGDFNELMHNGEKLGGPSRQESTFWNFRNMATCCKVTELRSTGNTMSWGGMRDRIWIQCRLDRSFGNVEWFHLFPRSQAEYLDMWASDHRPILLSFAYEPEQQARGRFSFDKRMINKPGIEDIIRKGWCGSENAGKCSVMERISNCSRELSKWKRSSNFNSKDKITNLRQRLEAEITKQYPNGGLLKRIKMELAKAYQEEEIF